MGSSGAGKTTLLNCMTSRNIELLEVTGGISINDKPVNQNQLVAQAAYVQQDDIFMSWLTVKEHLIFQALIRMNSEYTYKGRMKRVFEVIGKLSLTKCQDTLIGQPGLVKGISGGERKRLALASELLTNPSILFCDEPTSGLDSFMTLKVVEMLKKMAETGRTIICALHQPSLEVFTMFDKICLIAEGRISFLGSSLEADNFFRTIYAPCPINYNPADYYIQLLSIIPGREEFCNQHIERICDAFESSTLGQNIKREVGVPESQTALQQNVWSTSGMFNIHYEVTWFSQFRALSWRCWLGVKRNPGATKVRFYQVLALTLIIIAIFWRQQNDQHGIQNINGAIFVLLTNVTFQNLICVIMTFCGELPLFFRDHKNGMYRIDVYFLAKMIADLPLFTILNVIMTTICYLGIGLNPEFPRILIAIVIMMLVIYGAMSAGYLLSSFAQNIAAASSMVTVAITPFLILGGFFFSLRSIPSYFIWLSDFSWFKYGYSALLINQWDGVTNITCSEDIQSCLMDGKQILAFTGVEQDDFWISIMGLIGIIALFRILAFLCLLYRAHHVK